MKKSIALILGAAVLALPAPASALSAGHLNVEANLSEIKYEVEVCASRRHFSAHIEGLYLEEGSETVYSSDFYVHQRHHCATWTLEETTPMPEATWFAEMWVYSGGHSAHTGVAEFTVAE